MAPKYYFTTRDLLTIAILASLGGVMSTYVGYLANVINRLVGVPYGAGQVVAGLHILWLILILALTGKKGSGILGGALKGFVEFISGSHLGLFVAFFSLVEGIFTEIGFWPFKKYRGLSYMAGGAMGAFAYVLAQQLANQVFDNVFLFGAVSLLSIFSGAVFAGYFGIGIVDSLEDAGIVRREIKQKKASRLTLARALAVLFVLAIAFSAIYYFALVRLKGDPLQFTVMGDVAYTKDYYQPAYSPYFVTINARLDGAVTHLPAQNYTGLPVRYVLEDARIGPDATMVDFVGSDGYTQTLNVSEAMEDDDLIIAQEDGSLRLVARGYPGQLWVSGLKMIKVY
ncbi:ECF transporter S component [Methanocella conradii]|uniref:ECF transporter S component n=1 Tax=Methanocella conradii TaxID=1175444 RepID=UPI0024B32E05|nr:ECF transporter S component [Methanocella conradii]MDI6897193.1 ECF transporter S component [Methanocella conradii]